MYIINDICYAGNDTKEIRVKEALPLRGGMMLVTFTTGEKRLFDSTLLLGKAFEPVKNEDDFKNVNVLMCFMVL